ncbi:YceI family protein [Winogradskyella litorisediminis]|uniref:YceI family protein n=1 Tax=Winogradskyella litorisediminis TaxID=1156618 RepID=A0ABW3N4V2_9FLAO
MRNRLFITFFLWFSFIGFSQNSSIDFEIRNLGINVDGFFKKFSITTKFDASNNLKNFSGEITVNSIETGIESRDEHLLEEDYFYTKNYPKIFLESKEISKKSEGNYNVKAILKIKDKTKQINFPVKTIITKDSRKITAYFEINRRDFNVGGGSLVMSKTVKVSVVHIEKRND